MKQVIGVFETSQANVDVKVAQLTGSNYEGYLLALLDSVVFFMKMNHCLVITSCRLQSMPCAETQQQGPLTGSF